MIDHAQSKRIALFLLLLVGPLLAGSPTEAQVVISEFVADNESGLKDEDGDQSDWIEIHNAGGSAVNVGGTYLTDDASALTKWRLPLGTTIPGDGYLMVFASDKDRSVAGQELHANFKLKGDGEYLGLIAANGLAVLDDYSPQYPEQYDDISFGRVFSGGTVTATEAYFSSPSPGAANGAGSPVVINPRHSPQVPNVNESVRVEADLIAAPGTTLSLVMLRYRVMYQGTSIALMTDNGTGGDATAGDGTYTATIPAGVGQPGQMLRWFITADDNQGSSTRMPPFLDPTESPEYLGTMIDVPLATDLKTLHWFVANPSAANSTNGTQCSLFHAGEFYDNLLVRPRGNSSIGWPKKNYKFDCNPGFKFRFDPEEGRVEEFDVNSSWSDKSYVRRILSWQTYLDADVKASLSFPLRVQQNGSFFSVAFFVEHPDDDMLERSGLDGDGALYKMFNQLTSANSGVEKKTRQWEDNSDLAALVAGCQLSGLALETYLFDHVDVPAVINYIAATTLIHDNDHVHKNYHVYRDSDGDGEWRFIPWDKDLTFGRNYTLSGGVLNDSVWATKDPQSHPLYGDSSHKKNDGFWNRLIDAMHRTPRIQTLYLRRLRMLMDTLLQAPGTPASERMFEQQIDDWANRIGPDVVLDKAQWGIPAWGSPYDMAADQARLKNQYLGPRRSHLYTTHSVGVGIIPGSQAASPHLGFGVIESNPVSGDQDQEFVEIVNQGQDAIDISGWTLSGGIDFTFEGGSVVGPSDNLFVSPDLVTFRSRPLSPTGGEGHLVVGPYDGHIGQSEVVTLADASGAVIATNGPPQLSIREINPGSVAYFNVVGLNPGDSTLMILSLTGAGPIPTPAGSLDLTPPLILLGSTTANWSGNAELSFYVPPSASGLTLWLNSFLFNQQSFVETVQVAIP